MIDTALYDIRLYKKNKFQIPGTKISSLISPLIDIIGYFYLFCTACIFSGIGKKIIFYNNNGTNWLFDRIFFYKLVKQFEFSLKYKKTKLQKKKNK